MDEPEYDEEEEEEDREDEEDIDGDEWLGTGLANCFVITTLPSGCRSSTSLIRKGEAAWLLLMMTSRPAMCDPTA